MQAAEVTKQEAEATKQEVEAARREVTGSVVTAEGPRPDGYRQDGRVDGAQEKKARAGEKPDGNGRAKASPDGKAAEDGKAVEEAGAEQVRKVSAGVEK
jgi:hypothetical protein